MRKKVAVIGAGSWGVAISLLLVENGCSVKMWTNLKQEVEMINLRHEHVLKLPGVVIPPEIVCSTDLEEVVKAADVVVLVTPSQYIRQTAQNLTKHVEDAIVVCCSKGLEVSSGLRLSEVINQELPESRIVVLSGPSHAEEVARGIPTTVVASARNIDDAECVQSIFISPRFRVYTNTDIIGVELGGALKNVIALCAGISDGLGYGDNTKAALMTRGITEITRLGQAMGSDPRTFAGLTGVGDLIVTCTSMHSRNRRAGILIGQGKSIKEAEDEVKMVVEGIATTKAAYNLAGERKVAVPIITEAYRVLFEGKSPRQAVEELMMRDRKCEIEDM